MSVFYFAWVDQSETTFTTEHVREDEDVFSFHVSQSEGEFASLDVTIRNPRVGLLCASRKQWAWLSWFDGEDNVPLFFGRLVAVPEIINQELVKIIFTARPIDYNSQKIALAATLKVVPYWDDVFVDDTRLDDPDTVLEARSQLWHIDRITHAVSVSDMISGEDGTQEFTADDIIYESTQISFSGNPLRAVTVDANVGWSQPAIGSMTCWTGRVFDSFGGDGLIGDWPKPGSNIGSGWSVADSSAVSVPDIDAMRDDRFVVTGNGLKVIDDVLCYPDETPILNPINGEPVTSDNPIATASLPDDVVLHMPQVPSEWINRFVARYVFGFNNIIQTQAILVPCWHVRTSLSLAYNATRKRQEHVTFTLKSDVQDLIVMPDGEEPPVISVSGRDVGEPLPTFDSGIYPIGDTRRRSYFPTERGLQSLEYLVSLARSRLLVGSRVVQVSGQIPFQVATLLTLRMNGTAHDPRLPAGAATGKITSYSFGIDGSNGQATGSFTISCACGKGGTVLTVQGEPSYVEDDYVEDDYEYHDGSVSVLEGSNVGYSVPIDLPNDDGLNMLQPLRPADVISYLTVNNDADSQANAISTAPIVRRFRGALNAVGLNAVADIKTLKDQFAQVIKNMPTTISFVLKPAAAGPFTNVYELDLTDLVIPKMIDLEMCG